MAGNEKNEETKVAMDALASRYTLSENDLKLLIDSVGDDGDVNIGFKAIRNQKDIGLQGTVDDTITSINFELSSNGNANAFMLMHDFFTRNKKVTVKGPPPYEIVNGRMQFDFNQRYTGFNNGIQVLEYLTNLARFEPKMFQYFLIQSLQSDILDTDNFSPFISQKVREAEFPLSGTDELIDNSISSMVRNIPLYYMAAVGKKQMVNFIFHNYPEILEKNEKLAQTVEVFNRVSEETIAIYKEKIDIIDTTFFSSKSVGKTIQNIELEQELRDDMTLTDDINILSTNFSNRINEVATYGIGIGKIKTEDKEIEKVRPAYILFKGKLLENKLQSAIIDFRDILYSQEDPQVVKQKMID
jgi:hypothetical protein